MDENIYVSAINLTAKCGEISIPILQRKLLISYKTASEILDRMERENIINKQDGSKPRKVLKPNFKRNKVKILKTEELYNKYVEFAIRLKNEIKDCEKDDSYKSYLRGMLSVANSIILDINTDYTDIK